MDQGPVAPSRPWLAIGREIAGVLERSTRRPSSVWSIVFREPSRRWFFSGQGRSGLAAQMAAMRFMHMGRSAHFVGEATAPRSGRATDLRWSPVRARPRSASISPASPKLRGRNRAHHASAEQHASDPRGVVLPVSVGASDSLAAASSSRRALILLDAIVLEIAASAPDAHRQMLHRHTNLQ